MLNGMDAEKVKDLLSVLYGEDGPRFRSGIPYWEYLGRHRHHK